jgi:hypothetical protein
MTLSYLERSVNVVGLLDTGAAVNVLPYQVGIDLGAVWEENAAAIKFLLLLAVSAQCGSGR